jgi:hypothetical protein
MPCNASYTRFIFGKFFISTIIFYAFLYALLFAQKFYSCKKWVLQRSCSFSSLSSGKPLGLRYVTIGACQSKWTSMSSGDSDLLLVGGIFSRDDSAALLALVNALAILCSRSSCTKTPRGTIAQLKLSLDSSLVTLLHPLRIWRYSRPSKLFSNLRSSWQYISILSSKHDHSLLA